MSLQPRRFPSASFAAEPPFYTTSASRNIRQGLAQDEESPGGPELDCGPRSASSGVRFIYFCEDGLRYVSGLRAWIFFMPYLAGVVRLEPQLRGKGGDSASLTAWAIFVIFLLGFPPLWQATLACAVKLAKKIAASGMRLPGLINAESSARGIPQS